MKKIEIIEIRISRVYEVHSFFASQDIWSTVIHFEDKMGLRCVLVSAVT